MSNEAEIEVLKVVVSKLDESLEKMTDVSTNISKILAVHEQRIVSLEKSHDQTDDEAKILHKRITELFSELGDKLHAMEDRLELKYQKQQLNAQQQHNDIQKELQADIAELGKRIRALENWRWWMMGIGVGFGFIVAQMLPLFN